MVQTPVNSPGLGKLDHMRGDRDNGQTVQISRSHGILQVAGKTVKLGPIPFLTGAAALYTVLDAFGGPFRIIVPKSGIIQGIKIFETDDDAATTMTFNVYFFNQPPTVVADNAAIAYTAADIQALEAVVLLDTRFDFVNGIVYAEDNLGVAYTAPTGELWCQVQVAVGAPTIAATVTETMTIYILADE